MITTLSDFFTDPADDEQVQAMSAVERLVDKFLKDNKIAPTHLFVSDEEELQSYMLWAGMHLGLKTGRIAHGKSYVK